MSEARVRADLPAAPEVVFDHVVDAGLLATWWPTSAETDPRPGGPYRLRWAERDVTLRGTYQVVERPHRVAFTWSWDHDELESDVTITLAAVDTGTRLDLVQSATSDDERDDYVAGWEHFLGVLTERLGG